MLLAYGITVIGVVYALVFLRDWMITRARVNKIRRLCDEGDRIRSL